MVKLRPLKNHEFQEFMRYSSHHFAEAQVQAGFWDAEQAALWLKNDNKSLLPQGKDTPGHFFFRILNIQEIPVGYLWAIRMSDDQGSYIYLNDLVIQECQRRKGLARSALHSLEMWAEQENVNLIRLFVHPHNKEALSLYIRCGYYTVQDKPGYFEKTIL